MAINDQARPDGAGDEATHESASTGAETNLPEDRAVPGEETSATSAAAPDPVRHGVAPRGADRTGERGPTPQGDEADPRLERRATPPDRDRYPPYPPAGPTGFREGYPDDPPPYPPAESFYQGPPYPAADVWADAGHVAYRGQPGYPLPPRYPPTVGDDPKAGYAATEYGEPPPPAPEYPYPPYGDPSDGWAQDPLVGYGATDDQDYGNPPPGYPPTLPHPGAGYPAGGYPPVTAPDDRAGPPSPTRQMPAPSGRRHAKAHRAARRGELSDPLAPATVAAETAVGMPGPPPLDQPGDAPSGLVPGIDQTAGVDDATSTASSPEAQQARETADSLTSEALLHGKRPAPGSGWRRTIYKVSGGLIRVGESAAAQRRRELVWRVRTPVAGGHHRVAVLSLKGGVGKTTTTVGLGSTLATLRGDRVIAVDANPDRGTLSDKVRLETAATVRDLLNEREHIHRYADVRAYTSQAPSRLEVLASDRDPTVSVAFSEEDYCDVAQVLEHFYSICITDCGTGLLHSAMAGVLRLADQIVLVSSPSVDGARSASATLDWLEAHDYGDLVRGCVVVLSTVRPRSKSTVDLDRLEQHFAARSRAVVRIPYDPHLEEGAEVELDQLNQATTEAYLVLAATVADGFAWPRRAARRSA